MTSESWHQHIWELQNEPDDDDPDRMEEPCWCGAWTPNGCTCP